MLLTYFRHDLRFDSDDINFVYGTAWERFEVKLLREVKLRNKLVVNAVLSSVYVHLLLVVRDSTPAKLPTVNCVCFCLNKVFCDHMRRMCTSETRTADICQWQKISFVRHDGFDYYFSCLKPLQLNSLSTLKSHSLVITLPFLFLQRLELLPTAIQTRFVFTFFYFYHFHHAAESTSAEYLTHKLKPPFPQLRRRFS